MIGLLMMLATTSNYTVYQSGNELYARCQMQDQTSCLAYIIGVQDALADLASANITQPLFCAPVGATAEQLKDVAVLYLRNNPAARAQGAGGLVAAAFMEAFPCPAKPAG